MEDNINLDMEDLPLKEVSKPEIKATKENKSKKIVENNNNEDVISCLIN